MRKPFSLNLSFLKKIVNKLASKEKHVAVTFICILIFIVLWIQCLFLLWCMAPVTWNGSQIIYNQVVRPAFLRHEAAVDRVVSSLGGKAMDAAENLTREGAEMLRAPAGCHVLMLTLLPYAFQFSPR